jgi:4-hydroxybenzoate polyprenyltransferase
MTITASTASSTATQEPLAPIARPSLRGHLAIMRIDHWVKQVFVLPGIAIALTSDVTHITTRAWWTVPLGMVAVCLVSSSNYVINEVLDAPSDLSHPIKRHRPVPSGKVNVRLAYLQWIALAIIGIGISFPINVQFGMTMAGLWIMGCLYNISPVRSKDKPYIDVLSESINNPLRMLAGWYMTGTTELPPTSLLISYWMVGCYFMALKRYAEYRDIGDPARASAYRKSFAYYTLERLLVSIVFYSAAAMLFLGAFIMRYRLELIIAFPLVALVMAIYLGLAFDHESAVVNPEKLYREKKLMIAVSACAVTMMALMVIDVPVLYDVFKPTGLRI